MYKHILIPSDGSELAMKAVTHGIALAKTVGARVTAITVTEPFPVFATDPEILTDTPASYAEHMKAIANKTLAAIATAAKALDVACDGVTCRA